MCKILMGLIVVLAICFNVGVLLDANNYALPIKVAMDFESKATSFIADKFKISKSWAKTIVTTSIKHKLNPLYVAHLYKTESNFKHEAVSSKGYEGISQIPKSSGDPEEDMREGIKILSQKMKMAKNNLLKATAFYKGGNNPLARKQALACYTGFMTNT